jgi:hypothetical protein
MPHPNESIIRQLIIDCAPECHNPHALQQYLDEQAVYQIPGWNELSGVYKGMEQIATLASRRSQLLKGRQHHIRFVGTTASDEHVAVLHQFDADVHGKQITWRGNTVYFIKQGKIAECWLFVDDEEAFNEFWSA